MFVRYVRLLHNQLYYNKVYAVDAENIPEKSPLIIVSNHQNSMCDPLALLLSIRVRQERKLKVITRASVFQNPVSNRIMRWLGLLPAYRLSIDGDASFSNNNDTFREVEDELLQNGTVIIFPEGRHQDKHWLGKFSGGYLRMAFSAAEKSDFEKEIFILPTCNHYSNYFNAREDMLIKFGEPISLSPYYELYKTKPRTAQRQVNALVRHRVANLMLNIEDLENYEAIEFLRTTYGVKYAKDNGSDPNNLPEKLLSDQALISQLRFIKERADNFLQELYAKILQLKKEEEKLHIQDEDFDKDTAPWKIVAQGVLYLALLPLFLVSFAANILILGVPKIFTSKIKDKMFKSTIKLLISVITVPVTCFLIFIMAHYFSHSNFISLICMLGVSLLSIFVLYYRRGYLAWKYQVQFLRLNGKGKLSDLFIFRNDIYDSLNNVLHVDAQNRMFAQENIINEWELDKVTISMYNRM
ncbi:MAG: 1-acyl-sn-glycerol-3-phosphate acyltransferase [Bacteroidales bacterium]|jgi:1-acyl-sn-glycerol-3-phosphate acyltransferase|nr:1-acyl-sn-glycerol-3-phosphate acyltransferase [Bacteroidales bacterium]